MSAARQEIRVEFVCQADRARSVELLRELIARAEAAQAKSKKSSRKETAAA